MAVKSRRFLTLWCVWYFHTSLIAGVTGQDRGLQVDQISPIGDIYAGNNVSLRCVSTGYNAYHYFWWTKAVMSNAITLAHDGTSNDAKYSVTVEWNSQSSRTEVLTIINVDKSDSGNYICTAIISPTNSGPMLSYNVPLSVLYFPSDMYPVCIPNNSHTVQEGAQLNISCTTEEGHPQVQIVLKHGAAYSWEFVSMGDNFGLTSTLVVTGADNGNLIECAITSAGFPDREQSCFIGPLIVTRPGDVTDISTTTGPTSEATRSTLIPPQSPPTLYMIIIASNLAALLAASLIANVVLVIRRRHGGRPSRETSDEHRYDLPVVESSPVHHYQIDPKHRMYEISEIGDPKSHQDDTVYENVTPSTDF